MTTRVLERKVIYPGERVFKEGDEGNTAYVIEDGVVEIYKSLDGKEVSIGTVTKGGILGEMALIDNQPRMASARVIKTATLVTVPRATFQEKLAKADPFIRGLLGIFVKNIRAMTARKIENDSKPAEGKPAP